MKHRNLKMPYDIEIQLQINGLKLMITLNFLVFPAPQARILLFRLAFCQGFLFYRKSSTLNAAFKSSPYSRQKIFRFHEKWLLTPFPQANWINHHTYSFCKLKQLTARRAHVREYCIASPPFPANIAQSEIKVQFPSFIPRDKAK
jgi:hypothetical protein